jgi:hypothetical protein
MYNDYNKADYKSIEMILRDIEEKKLLLPEFQRDFVWSIEHSIDLFDSISRGIFIGSLIIAQPSFDLYCKGFNLNPRRGRGSKKPIFEKFYAKKDFEIEDICVLLDGQQRVTSIYRALTGHDDIYFILKRYEQLPSPNEEITRLDKLIEGFTQNKIPDNLCIAVKDIYACIKEDWREKKIEEEILDIAIGECPAYHDKPEIREVYFDIILKLKKIFGSIIADKTLLSVFLLDMDLEKFCLFFERSNSKGISLNFIDIITAKVYKGFNLRQQIEKFGQRYKKKLDNQTVESFVRYISYIKTKYVDRKTILTMVDDNDFKSYWDLICSLYNKSINFLVSEKLILEANWLPYKTIIIPIMNFLKNLPSQDFSQRNATQDKLFKFWFWASLILNRYGGGASGSTNDIIEEDCMMMEDLALKSVLNNDVIKKFRFNFEFEDLIDIDSRGAKFNCIMSIINYKYNLRDWRNNGNIDFKAKVDIHHIFPTNYIERMYGTESLEYELSDCILNKALVAKVSNIKFRNQAPSEYLQKLSSSNPNIVDALDTHLLPNADRLIEGDYDKNFIDFLHDRYELIKKLLIEEIVNVRNTILEETVR